MRAASVRVDRPAERHPRRPRNAIERRLRSHLPEARVERLGRLEVTDRRRLAVTRQRCLLGSVDRQALPTHEHMFAYPPGGAAPSFDARWYSDQLAISYRGRAPRRRSCRRRCRSGGRGPRRRPTGRSRRRRGEAIGIAADRRQEAERVRMAVEHGDDRRRPVGREQLVEDRVRRRRRAPAAPAARGRRGRPRSGRRRRPATPAAASSSAAASTSGMIAPTADERDLRRAGARAQDVAAARARRRRRRSRASASSGTAASAWSIGRVVRRKYADVAVRAAEQAERVRAASTRGPGRRPAPTRCSAAARGRPTAS